MKVGEMIDILSTKDREQYIDVVVNTDDKKLPRYSLGIQGIKEREGWYHTEGFPLIVYINVHIQNRVME